MSLSRGKKGREESLRYEYEPGDLETKVTESGLDVSFRARVVSDLLVCPICMGFFRGATTIRECLHTFCKACIINHIEQKSPECPTCGQFIGVYPLQGLVFDRTIQNITDKIFPEFKENERKLYNQFIENYGKQEELDNGKELISVPKPTYSQILNETRLTPVDYTKQFYTDVLYPGLLNGLPEDTSFLLNRFKIRVRLDPVIPGGFELERPFLVLPPQVTVFHIQNYLIYKSNGMLDKFPVISLRGGVVLPRNHSIEFVCRSRKIPLGDLLVLEFETS